MLIRRFRVPAFLFVTFLAFSFFWQSRSSASLYAEQEGGSLTPEQAQARDALNQGVEAFKNGQYEEAARLFERAKQLDARMSIARLYLATTYASQYIPGAPSEQNERMGRSAIEEYKALLRLDPQNVSAIDGAGSIIFQMAGTPFNRDAFLESKTYFQKHIEIQPDDPEPYYWVGVIDWTLSFRGNTELRSRFAEYLRSLTVTDADPLPPELRAEYKREFETVIEEGIQSIKKAIELRPDYDDAMAYLNLLYRRKADTAERTEERDRLAKMADDLLDKIKEIKQKRAESPSQPQ